MKKRFKILIVEDEPTDAELLIHGLKKGGFSFESRLVDNESDYTIALKEFEPDIILSDYSMPSFNGLAALLLKQECRPLVPFILVTGSVNEDVAVEIMKSGADDYLLKKNLARIVPAVELALRNSEIKKAREIESRALFESWEFNDSLLRSIPFGMHIVDEEGTIMYINDINRNAFTGAAEGKKCWEMYREDRSQCPECPLRTGIKTGETQICEVKDKMKDKVFSISYTGILYKEKRALLKIFQDITESKKMEQKVRESETYYRTMVDLSPDGIVISDLEGRVSFSSSKTKKIFGLQPQDEVVGESILKWVDSSYRERVKERIWDILNGNVTPELREYKLLKDDGTRFWGEIASSPMEGKSGLPENLLIVCRDISERKKAEEELLRAKNKAEENDRLKTAFLHNISHEIRTPMNAITGLSSLLLDEQTGFEDKKPFLEMIVQSSNRLLQVVNDIIEMSGIESGNISVCYKNANIMTVFEEAVRKCIPGAQAKGLELVLLHDPGLKYFMFETDSTKLEQIITRLVENAVKFTAHGKIKIGYSFTNANIDFYVSDTGIGITSENQARIFERFYQVDYGVNRQYEGIGLGLTISKAYAELMGGSIRIKSQPGTGSVFHVTLPLLQSKSRDINTTETACA